MGELTRKAASSPIPNPLSDFPLVWCAAVPPSSSPVHWVLSIFHAILSTPVSLAERHHQTSFPGCGSWICEIGKLSVSLLLFSPPFYTFPPLFSSRVRALPPRSRVNLHEGTKGSSEYSEEYVTAGIRDDVLFLPVSIFNSRRWTSNGEKNRVICFSLDRVYSLKVLQTEVISGLRRWTASNFYLYPWKSKTIVRSNSNFVG